MQDIKKYKNIMSDDVGVRSPIESIDVNNILDDEKFREEKGSRKKYYKRMVELHAMQAKYENQMCKKVTGVNLMREMSYSKRLMATVIYSSIAMLFLSYILAFLGRDQIAETLSSTIAQVVFSSVIAYFGKALLENALKYNSELFSRLKKLKNDLGEQSDDDKEADKINDTNNSQVVTPPLNVNPVVPINQNDYSTIIFTESNSVDSGVNNDDGAVG